MKIFAVVYLGIFYTLFPNSGFSMNFDELEQCKASIQKDTLCWVNLNQLRSTQVSVGMIEVREKQSEIEKKISNPEALLKYKLSHPIPSVIGPKGEVFAIDHHHLALAALLSGISNFVCKIYANFSSLNMEKFWHSMDLHQWVYPFDLNGEGPEVSLLPEFIQGLKDDPYRSFAGAIRDAGGYKKVPIPFAEFAWAMYFKLYIVLPSELKSFDDTLLQQGLEIAHYPAAINLPGYIGN